MFLGQEIHVFGNWFILHFVENRGMAFGMQFAGDHGKLVLSIFRIISSGVIFWYLLRIIRQKKHPLFIVSLSLIFAGAVGNIIDSAFYGLIFNESGDFLSQTTAVAFPPEGGYAPFLYGKVVDMLYFPIIQGYYPSWFPIVGGEEFLFFRPVFNLADSSITTGVLMLLVFQKKIFSKQHQPLLNKQEDNSVISSIE